MRDHSLLRPQPFTVSGDMSFIAKSFSMKNDMARDEFEGALTDDQVRIFVHTDKTCLVTSWECTCEAGQEPQYTVTATPIRMHTPVQQVAATVADVLKDMNISAATGPALDALYERYVDPWVQVGTTTIDGNLKQVYEALAVSPWPWLCASDTIAAIDHFMRAEHPWLVGGRCLRGVRSHVDAQADTVVIHCDVVRRQSDLGAEQAIGKADGECKSCGAFDCLSTHGTCARCCDRAENPCPECGPHGNAGRVLLLESWVDCTTCRPTAAALSVEFDGAPPLRRDPIIASIETYSEGDRVVDRWGRRGVVIGMSGTLVRVQMDEGWTGLHATCELTGKVDR